MLYVILFAGFIIFLGMQKYRCVLWIHLTVSSVLEIHLIVSLFGSSAIKSIINLTSSFMIGLS